MYYTKLKNMPSVSDYQQHQLLSGFFDDYADRPFCFCDTGSEIILLSSQKPKTDCTELQFKAGQTLMFECRASINDRRYNGVKHKAKDYSDEQIKEWFRRRLEACAYVDYVAYKRYPPHKIQKLQTGETMIFNQTMFFGTLTVIDAKEFERVISHGIGRGGAFGFGAMIIPQVMT